MHQESQGALQRAACSVSKSLPTTHPGSLVEEQPAKSWLEVVQVAAEPVAVGRTPGQELLRELEAELEAEAATGAVRPGTPGSEVRERCVGWSWSRRRGMRLRALLQAMRCWKPLVNLTRSYCDGWR